MSRRELLRFVRDDSGCVVFDQRQRLPGRGVWTCCTLDCFDMAVARGALARGLKLPGVAAREALSEEVIGKLRTSVASYLSISK
ncbi:MAG: YlxR family protein [Coriobacteriia bacterium]|nr:YlxR family protein [Coriobacteriia bacterium]